MLSKRVKDETDPRRKYRKQLLKQIESAEERGDEQEAARMTVRFNHEMEQASFRLTSEGVQMLRDRGLVVDLD